MAILGRFIYGIDFYLPQKYYIISMQQEKDITCKISIWQ